MRKLRVSPCAQIRGAIRAAAALLVLFTITADILADSRCHPATRTPVGAGLQTSAPSGDQDPCNTRCVPDCFCCSQLVPGVAIAVPPAILNLVATTSDRVESWSIGVHPTPYHPPLLLS